MVLDGRDDSSWKEEAHPAPTHWMHSRGARRAEIDDEVVRWLEEAADLAR